MMKEKIFAVLGSVLVSSFLYAQDIQVTQDWQLLGATESISVSSFDGKCVDFVWKYDKGWKLYIANGNSYNLSSDVTEFNTINKGEGFWVKGNGNCDINTSNAVDIKALLAGKTFYVAGKEDNTIKIFKFVVNSDATVFQQYDLNGQFTDDGSLIFNDNKVKIGTGNGHTVFVQKDGYILGMDYDDNDILENSIGHRLYENKSDAEAYYNSLTSNQNTSFKFTKEWLTAHTLYNAYEDNMHWSLAKFTFTDTIMHGEDAILNEENNATMDVEYSITPEGYIAAPKPAEWNEGDGNFTIAVVDKNDTAMKLCWSNPENIQSCINGGGDDEYFLLDYQKAKDFVNAKNANIIANSEKVTISGKVTFKDKNGGTIAIPDDARIRITSDTDQNNHKWENGFNIGINSDRTFSLTKNQYKNTYKQGHTFQVVVYKNHIKPEENMWDCGEDTYKYVGNNVAFNNWQNIVVTPEDYQDRSGETCNN